MPFAQIKTHLISLYGSVRSCVTEAAVQDFCTRQSAELPHDLRRAYDLMNGADHPTNPYGSWMRFWPIEEWISAKDSLPPAASAEDQDKLFILADYGIECVYYAMNLKPRSSGFGCVYALGATQTVPVAASFSRFVELVLSDSDALHQHT